MKTIIIAISIFLVVVLLSIFLLLITDSEPVDEVDIEHNLTDVEHDLVGVWRRFYGNWHDFFVFRQDGTGITSASQDSGFWLPITWRIEDGELRGSRYSRTTGLRASRFQYSFVIENGYLILQQSGFFSSNREIKYEFYSDNVNFYYRNPLRIERSENRSEPAPLAERLIFWGIVILLVAAWFRRKQIHAFIKKKRNKLN